DVEDLGAIGNLLARDLDRLVVAVLLDQLLEFRAAGDVGAFADVDEQQLGRDDQRLEAGQAGVASFRHWMELMCLSSLACHPERSEGSASCTQAKQIPRC